MDCLKHIDWTKSKAELAVDLQVVATPEYVGYSAHSLLLDNPEVGLYAFAPSRDDAIDEVVCLMVDRFAPDEVGA